MRSLFKAALAVAAMGLVGCGGGNKIVGFVVNGQTGERVNIFKNEDGKKPENQNDDDDSKSQIYAILDGRFTRAVPCDAGDANEDNGIQPDGCYMIENVPFDQQIPIFAQIEGFERFHGTLSAIDTNELTENFQRVANLRVFPVGFAMNYSVSVHHNGTGVPNATVMCQIRQGQNTLATDGNFLAPENTTSQAISLTTDNDGNATIEGSRLVNGATYKCEAFRSDLFNGNALSGETTFVAGVDQPALHIAVNISGSLGFTDELYALRSNADGPNDLLGDGAGLTIFFNRPVELVPRTQDCHVATITSVDFDNDGNTPSTRPYEKNDSSESVTATFSPDGMSLTLNYRLENPIDPDDINVAVSFHGIYIRPVASGDNIMRLIGTPVQNTCDEAGRLGAVPALKNARLNGLDQPTTIRLF